MLGARAGVRDGVLTSFWTTRWLDSGIILADWANELDPDFNPSDRVADFVEGDDGWNLNKLNRLLPNDIVEQVVGRSPPREELGPDTWVWGESHDGRFKISSAYKILTDQNPHGGNDLFRKLWKWNGPCRTKFFLWLAFRERLLTNAERYRRHMSDSASCLRCGSREETVCHVLRDCPVAEGVWRELGFNITEPNWRGSIADWFSAALWGERGELFGISAWMIWKCRNEAIFQNSYVTPAQIAQRALRWSDTVKAAFDRDARCFGDRGLRRWEFVSWEPGPLEGVTINTDGSYSPSLNRASAGGIIRDWRVTTRHVFREANKAADFLASQGYEFPFGTHLFPLSDCNLGHILRYDCLEIAEPRLIPIVN
ncbi:Putative ribonuclease H protein At1g65750 [Linum perenne]